MNLKDIGLSTSSFGYAMGNTGKNTDRKNPEPWTLEKFIEFAASLGFGGIEAPLARFVPDLDPTRLREIKSMLLKHEMFFIMDAEKALDIEEIKALMPQAAEFGSKIIRIKTSSILECARKKINKPWSEHVNDCIRALSLLAPQLREYGLKIAIENHQDVDSNDLVQIIDAVGADVLGVNFDIGNAFSTCEDPVVFATKLGSSILNVHLKDYKVFKSDDGFRLVRAPVGAGSVDFKAILPIIEKNSPRATMVVELGALESRSIAWLRNDFWDQIQPRKVLEREAFSKLIENEAKDDAHSSWRTPWEKGSSASEIISYEIREVEESLPYIKQL